MRTILLAAARRAAEFADVQPLLALFLGGALLTLLLCTLFRKPDSGHTDSKSLVWIIYHQWNHLLWSVLLVSLVALGFVVLRNELRRTVADFERHHGRITEANYNAVQSIWGAEQVQGELQADLFWEEEATERIESEDVTKPAVLRKKVIRHNITSNPFVTARHDVVLKQNPRKKGSAIYGGYETVCRFTWRLRNPADRPLQAQLKFPLPAAGAIYDDLSARLDDRDILPDMQLKEATLILSRELSPNQEFNLAISFKSRGMSFWYFQVREAREIRDFALRLELPDLPKAKLNYPEGCMTPTAIESTNDGCVLTYKLDHAISGKGMGISLPQLPQPGETTAAVLRSVEDGWTLVFAALLLAMALEGIGHGPLLTLLLTAAISFGFGLLGNFSDLVLGFWGTLLLVLLPLFAVLALLTARIVKGLCGALLALQLVAYGCMYPVLAALDSERAVLYLNCCALALLAFVSWRVGRKMLAATQVERSLS